MVPYSVSGSMGWDNGVFFRSRGFYHCVTRELGQDQGNSGETSEWFGDPGGRYKHADLLSDRGYLIYVARTYSHTMNPYLKGLILTVNR
jgi:hypothetical protein